MNIEAIGGAFSVGKIKDISSAPKVPFTFTAITDNEVSVVCPSEYVPENVIERSDGWRAFRVKGSLDFSLIGILARIAGLLAENHISLFAVSTFDTDYVLVREGDYERALGIISGA